jgi:hypothetical protein
MVNIVCTQLSMVVVWSNTPFIDSHKSVVERFAAILEHLGDDARSIGTPASVHLLQCNM